MHDPALRARRSARFALPVISFALISASASAQYSSGGFEALTASAGGTLLTGQDTWTLPVTTPVSVDWNAFTYAGNTLTVPANPWGSTKFCAGAPVGTSLCRAERVVPWAITNNKYTLSVDVYCKYVGAATPVNNIGGFSLQPSTTNRSLNMIMVWPATPTGATWDAQLATWTSANVANATAIPNPGFQGLATNKWYRWQTDFDMANNTILETRITDIVGGTTVSYAPVGAYLFGGANPTIPMPTAIRMFVGGDAGNLVAADNLELRQMSEVTPGRSVATVIDNGVTTVPGNSAMYVLDHAGKSATALTMSTALTQDRVNCVNLYSGAAGWVGTNPLPANTPGNVYAISISGTTVTETKLNTTATAGGNVAQIARVGSNLWFITQNAAGAGGILQSVPVSGGPVTTAIDLTTITGWTGLANAVCAIGTKVYVGAFDSGTVATTTGCIAVYDTATSTGSILLALPQGKYISGVSNFNTGLVHMQVVNGNLVCIGVYGDLLTISPAGAVLSHQFSGFIGTTTTLVNSTNSGDYDPATGDIILGSRDGACDRVVSGQSAEKVITGVGPNATATLNSVTGLSHRPASTTAKDTSYAGSGCANTAGYKLTDAASGLPTSPNPSFKLSAFSGTGGDLVACLIASVQLTPPIDLTIIGMPACNLSVNSIAVTLGGALTGVGDGLGKLDIALPIPSGLNGVVVYRQWAEVQVTKSNLLGVVVSNARKMEIVKL